MQYCGLNKSVKGEKNLSILGSAGYIYMLILMLLLVIGFGLTGLWIINYFFNNTLSSQRLHSNIKGGKGMDRWIRLAVFSLIGIVISMILLAFITPGGMTGGYNIGIDGMMSQPMYMQGGAMGMPYYSNTGMMNMMPMSNMQQGGMGMMNMMPMSTCR